eukprot:SAG22_NODE_66_length_22936_cov_626.714279_10_plen_67_part_00
MPVYSYTWLHCQYITVLLETIFLIYKSLIRSTVSTVLRTKFSTTASSATDYGIGDPASVTMVGAGA